MFLKMKMAGGAFLDTTMRHAPTGGVNMSIAVMIGAISYFQPSCLNRLPRIARSSLMQSGS